MDNKINEERIEELKFKWVAAEYTLKKAKDLLAEIISITESYKEEIYTIEDALSELCNKNADTKTFEDLEDFYNYYADVDMYVGEEDIPNFEE